MNVNGIRHPLVPFTRQNPRPSSTDGAAPDSGRQTDVDRTVVAPQQRTARAAAAHEVLNEEEKKFFEGLYTADEMRLSTVYSRGGRTPERNTGTLLDRKG
jgi:hypothetical protein